MEDLQTASKLLVQAISIRDKYIHMSKQNFPNSCAKFMRNLDGKNPKENDHQDRATLEGDYIYETY